MEGSALRAARVSSPRLKAGASSREHLVTRTTRGQTAQDAGEFVIILSLWAQPGWCALRPVRKRENERLEMTDGARGNSGAKKPDLPLVAQLPRPLQRRKETTGFDSQPAQLLVLACHVVDWPALVFV